MSVIPLVLLDRALRYREQATKARQLACGVASHQVARGLSDLARTLERKAMRAERMSAVLQVKEQRGHHGQQDALAAD
jgi:hypothetical protein